MAGTDIDTEFDGYCVLETHFLLDSVTDVNLLNPNI